MVRINTYINMKAKVILEIKQLYEIITYLESNNHENLHKKRRVALRAMTMVSEMMIQDPNLIPLLYDVIQVIKEYAEIIDAIEELSE